MTGSNETVSQEAFDRVKREKADLETKLAEANTQVADATVALADYQKRDAARTALKGKVADPDAVADLITPHLKDVETAKVAEHIASEGFQPRLAAFKAAETPAPPEGGDGEGAGVTPAEEPGSGGFGGPSPGGDGGSQPVGGKTPIKVGSTEYYQLLADPAAYAQAEKDNRIVQATPAYR
jgi:hypothetical protein